MRLPCLVVVAGLLAASGALGWGQALPGLAGPVTFLDDPLQGDAAVGGDLVVQAGDHVQLVMNGQEDSSCYLLDIAAPKACFYKLAGGKTRAVGAVGQIAAEALGQAQPFSLLHKGGSLLFAVGGRVVCRGWDDGLAKGRAGYIGRAEQVVDPFVQLLAPIEATDNFMREQDAQHMWTALSGAWQIKSLRDDDQADRMEADKSANAFSYLCTGSEGAAVTVAERDHWFWTNYEIEASACSTGSGAIGLVLLAQDQSNFVAFRWSSGWDDGARGSRAELLEVVDGTAAVLAERPGGFIPGQWYKLTAGVCDGWINCAVDGVPLLSAHSDRFGHGNAGLYAEGDETSLFDDVVIRDHQFFSEDFANLARWDTVSGDWSATGAGEARCVGAGVLASGSHDWDNYRAAVTAVPNRGKLGLQVARQPDGRAVLYRLSLNGGARAQLLTVGPDGEQLLAERDVKLNGAKALRLAATVEGGFVRAFLDDEVAVEGFAADCPRGAVGLYADADRETRFDNLQVAFQAPRQAAEITREFTKTSEHQEMSAWAGPRAAWVQPPEMKPGATWWTKGDYFGDAAVSFKVRFVGLRDGRIKVTLGGNPAQPQAGVHLVLTARKDVRALTATLLNGTTEMASHDVELPESSCSVLFARQGECVVVRVNDAPIIEQRL